MKLVPVFMMIGIFVVSLEVDRSLSASGERRLEQPPDGTADDVDRT